MSTRNPATGVLSPSSVTTLRRISEDTDASALDPNELRPLRLEGFIYTVENEVKGTFHAHLKDRGREALGLPTYGSAD